jgi:hypothetical protein
MLAENIYVALKCDQGGSGAYIQARLVVALCGTGQYMRTRNTLSKRHTSLFGATLGFMRYIGGDFISAGAHRFVFTRG